MNEHRNILAALRRRHLRTDLDLTRNPDGSYRYWGQSPVCPSLRTDLTIRKQGRNWFE